MGHTFPPDDDTSVGALDNEGRNSGRPFTAAAHAVKVRYRVCWRASSFGGINGCTEEKAVEAAGTRRSGDASALSSAGALHQHRFLLHSPPSRIQGSAVWFSALMGYV